jgi:hypothetical protein
MRYAAAVLAMLAPVFLPGVATAAGNQTYDGAWQTTVSCAGARDALGYSFRFVSTVKDGVLHGLHGAAGQPSSLQIDGTIGPDGSGKLYAIGYTNSKEYVPGRDTAKGTQYSYNIDAHFAGSSGTGKRVEGRPCTVEFSRQ